MTDLVLFTDSTAEMPAHLKNMGGLGSDNVDSSDLATPRINLLQQLSPQVNKNKTEFVKGAEPGMLFNTVTSEVSDKILCVNLYYDKTFSVFKKRKLGKDFQGNHESNEAAVEHLKSQGLDPTQYDITETANHYLLVLDEKGNPVSPAITSMASSKMRISKQWNTELQLLTQKHDVARFGSVWELSSKSETNARGEEYHNLAIAHRGWVNEALLERARVEYEGIANRPEIAAA